MRQVSVLVQALVCLMFMLNGLLLMMTRDETWPSVLLLVSPILLCIAIDRKRWYELPSWAANVIGLGVGVYAIYYFLNNSAEKHLAIISDLVTYLILTLLLQAKSPRLYWQLAILSVLQAVVASVFSLNLQQGTLFLFYIGVVLSTLSAIVLNRDQMMAAGRLDELQNVITDSRTISSLKQEGVLRAIPAPQHLSNFAFGYLITSIITLAILSVGVGMLVYLSMPNGEKMNGVGTLRLKQTGVNWRIDSLEPSGVLQQDKSESLRIRIVDRATRLPKKLADDLYLRGTCLEVLEPEETGWSPYQVRSRLYNPIYKPLPAGRIYDQEIVMTPTEDPMLFSAAPMAAPRSVTEEVTFNPYNETLYRRSDSGVVARTPFRYELGLYGIRNGQLPAASPFLNYRNRNFDQALNEDLSGRYERLIEFNPDKFPTLVAKAKEIEATIPNAWRNRIGVARALENYLANSGQFSYTIDFTKIKRDPSLDPVEDFVANYRTGHCELYASALAIMLRSLEIPSRVVVGYRVGRYNEVAELYQVQARHAHSWVEAYLAPSQCSPEMLANGDASSGGAWLRLDPTPGAGELEDEDSTLIGQANDAFGYAQSLWDDYILGMKTEKSEKTDSFWSRFSQIQAFLDLSRSSLSLQEFFLRMNPVQKAFLGLALFVAVAWWHFKINRPVKETSKKTNKKQKSTSWSRVLSLVGIGTAQPWDIEHWSNGLLERLEQMAIEQGLHKRRPSQTPLEYVTSIATATALPIHSPGDAPAESLAPLRVSAEYGLSGQGEMAGVSASTALAEQLQTFAKKFYDLRYGSLAGLVDESARGALVKDVEQRVLRLGDVLKQVVQAKR